jgi:hypothetical protein
MVVHTYDPRFLRGGGRRIMSSRPVWAKLMRPYVNNKIQKGLRTWLKWYSVCEWDPETLFNPWRDGVWLFLVFFFLSVLGFELRTSLLVGRCCTTWATLPTLFCVGYFWDRISWNICLGWLWTFILLISASWGARITGVRHWCPARSVCCLQETHFTGKDIHKELKMIF